MPVMDGYKATEQIKATTKGQATAIVALTASAFEEEKAVILSAGCDDFLRKPFKEAEIFDMLAKHLGVQFVYEEENVGAQGTVPLSGAQCPVPLLTPEAIAALPDPIRSTLQAAAETADLEIMLTLIEQVRQDNEPLAEALSEVVNAYRFDVLQALFAQIE
jgi:CheY-like chemotaxis protein